MSVRGITLIELIVVIVLLGILLTLAVSALDSWRTKASIESDTKRIYALLQKARAIAFSRKADLSVRASSKTICIYNGTNQIECVDLANPFSGSVEVSRRGYFSATGSIKYVGSTAVDVHYNCVVVSINRVRVGELDGNSCKPK